MIKRIYFVFICLAAVTLTVLNISQHQEIVRLSHVENQQTSARSESKSNLTSGDMGATQSSVLSGESTGSADSNAYDLLYHLGAAEEELDMANQQLTDVEEWKAEIKKSVLEFFKNQFEKLKDPSTKEMFRNSILERYGNIIKELNLSPEELEEFKDILAEKEIAQQYIPAEFFIDAYTYGEERANYKQLYEEMIKEYEAKMIDLLGRDGYEEFKEYQDTESVRFRFKGFADSLFEEDKLTDNQQEKLIEAMYNEKKKINTEYNITEYNIPDRGFLLISGKYDERYVAKLMEGITRQDEACVTAASQFLSPSQTEQLEAYLKQYREMTETEINANIQGYHYLITQKGSEKRSE